MEKLNEGFQPEQTQIRQPEQEEAETKARQAVRRIRFPWATVVMAMAAITVTLMIHTSWAVQQWPGLAGWPKMPLQILLAMLPLITAVWEYRRWKRQVQAACQQQQRLEDEISRLLFARRQLQQKAHTYLEHSDKLKRFIGDRLLEYIQYDEKFLHFKSIAGEVRHNGVIAYDQIRIALEKLVANEKDLLEIYGEGTRDEAACELENNLAQAETALKSLYYLWDLLDLSTADNLSLHISNSLIEREEQWYQRILQQGNSARKPGQFLYHADEELLHLLAPLTEKKLPDTLDPQSGTLVHDDREFRLNLKRVPALFGNPNHFRLLMENLMKNARYFAGQSRQHQQGFPTPVAIGLTATDAQINLRIYNPGEPISDEAGKKLFQLGYSTRPAEGWHGQGLGLYFASEIVKGYEGRIGFENVVNRETRYRITIKDETGNLKPVMVTTQMQGNRLVCGLEGNPLTEKVALPCPSGPANDEPEKHRAWNNLEVVVEDIESGHSTRFHAGQWQSGVPLKDPCDPLIPRWQLQFEHGELFFIPQDITGVVFTIALPSAESRLRGETFPDEENDTEMLRKQFPFME